MSVLVCKAKHYSCSRESVCIWVVGPYRVRPQGSDDFGQRQLPKFLHVRSVDQTLRGVKDVILHNKEARWRERRRVKTHDATRQLAERICAKPEV